MGSAGFGAGSNIENITVKGSSGGNTYNLSSFKSGSKLKIFGGSGADTMNFGSSDIVNEITSIGSFSFDGQGGSNTFNVNNTGTAYAFGYTQTSGNIALLGGGTTYSLGETNVQKFQYNAGSQPDSFNIEVVPTGSQTIINGNAGLDSLSIGYAANNLDSIQGPIYFNTGADAGGIAISDTADTTGDVLHFTMSSIGATPGDTLFGPGGALYFDNILGYTAYPGITLNLGSGADSVFAEPLTSAYVVIYGNNPTTTPGDTLRVSLATATGPVLTQSGTNGSYSFTNRAQLVYQGFESVSAAIPGDNDLNGTVNSADYSSWRAGYGKAVPLGTGSDANGDGKVNLVDYIVWRNNLGRHSPGAGSGTALESIPVAADVTLQPTPPAQTEVSPSITKPNTSFIALPDRGASHPSTSRLSIERPQAHVSRDEFFDQLLLQLNSSRRAPIDTPGLKSISESGDPMTDTVASASNEALAALFDDAALPASMLRSILRRSPE